MKEKINIYLKIILILVVFELLIITLKGLSNYSIAANSIKTVNPENYDIEAKTKVIGNCSKGVTYSGLATYICSGVSRVTTLLDNKNNLNLVYFDNDNVYIQKLDSNNKVAKLLTIKKKYPVYGSTIIDKNGNYYISWGQNNTKKLDDLVTFSIAKYDNNGNYIASFEKKNNATSMLFEIGTCHMAINSKGILAYDYTHKMRSGHQANVTGYVDTVTMQMADETYRAYPYTSHCMNSVVNALSTDEFLFTDQGDAYRRGITHTLISDQLGYNDKSKLNATRLTFHFREGAAEPYAYNYTFANLANVIELDTGFALIACSENTLSLDPAPKTKENESRNIFIQIIKKDSFLKKNITSDLKESDYVTKGIRNSVGTKHESDYSKAIQYFNDTGIKDYGVKWLTNYSNKYTVIDVKAVKVDNNRIAIIWEQENYNVEPTAANITYYMVIDNKGNIVQDKTLIEQGRVPSDAQPVYKDGYIYFTNSDGTNNLKLYRFKLYNYINKVDPVYPSSISIDKTEYKNLEGSTLQLNVTYNPINSTEKNVVWSSSNTSVATVSKTGFVTIVGEGEAIIKAKLPNENVAQCKIIGLSKNVNIAFDKSLYVVNLGNTQQLNYKIKEVNSKEIDKSKLKFTISDSKAGVINEKNEFIPNESYKDKIVSITANYIDKVATAKIRIIGESSFNWSFKLRIENNNSIKNGETKKVTLYQDEIKFNNKVQDVYANKFELDINYDAKNLEVQSTKILIDNLKITSMEKGKIHIVLDNGEDVVQICNKDFIDITFKAITNSDTTNEITGTKLMQRVFAYGELKERGTVENTTIKTIKTIPLNSISLNKTSLNTYVGDTNKLEVAYNPINTTDSKNIIWTSSNNKVATVDNNGNVKSISSGKATITAKVGSKTASCNIVVNNKIVETKYQLGDVNKDGKINSLDATLILKYVSKKKNLTEEQLKLADVTKDGKVNSLDAVRILKYVAKKITEF